MDLSKAIKISALVGELEQCEKILEKFTSGFKDEWVLRNEHTGVEVELSLEQFEVFLCSVKDKKQGLERALSAL